MSMLVILSIILFVTPSWMLKNSSGNLNFDFTGTKSLTNSWSDSAQERSATGELSWQADYWSSYRLIWSRFCDIKEITCSPADSNSFSLWYDYSDENVCTGMNTWDWMVDLSSHLLRIVSIWPWHKLCQCIWVVHQLDPQEQEKQVAVTVQFSMHGVLPMTTNCYGQHFEAWWLVHHMITD